MTQPAMTNDQGVVITVGIQSLQDRCEIVLPIASDAGILTPILQCYLAVQAVKHNILPDLLVCMSSDADVRFIAAEGMVDGIVPYREDYPGATYNGSDGTGMLPSSNGLLLVFYEEPTDVVPGHKIRVGHNTIPGQCPDSWPDGQATTAIVGHGVDLANLLVAGFAFEPTAGSEKWYRVLAVPARTPGTALKRTCSGICRGYIGTQRRRLVPH